MNLHFIYVTMHVLLCPTSCRYHIHAQEEHIIGVQKLLHTYSYIVHTMSVFVHSFVYYTY
jgi:hypothetical protein